MGHNVPYGYRCPAGGPGASFPVDRLEEAWWLKKRSWGSALDTDERAALDPEVALVLGGTPPVHDDRVAIDFRCSRCGNPVVVVFRAQPVERDDWEFEPIQVLELGE